MIRSGIGTSGCDGSTDVRTLIVTAVDAEARALDAPPTAVVIVAGIGRTNAAAATTEALCTRGPFDRVLSVGVAGALPGSDLAPGDVVLASACVYAEEGLVTPEGFSDMRGLGFPLGDFEGNCVPVDEALLALNAGRLRTGRVATVATCSGTDAAAAEVVARTGAVAEAMEGAAVVHAARRAGVPGGELRAISNTTGNRAQQRWDLPRAFSALAPALASLLGG